MGLRLATSASLAFLHHPGEGPGRVGGTPSSGWCAPSLLQMVRARARAPVRLPTNGPHRGSWHRRGAGELALGGEGSPAPVTLDGWLLRAHTHQRGPQILNFSRIKETQNLSKSALLASPDSRKATRREGAIARIRCQRLRGRSTAVALGRLVPTSSTRPIHTLGSSGFETPLWRTGAAKTAPRAGLDGSRKSRLMHVAARP